MWCVPPAALLNVRLRDSGFLRNVSIRSWPLLIGESARTANAMYSVSSTASGVKSV